MLGEASTEKTSLTIRFISGFFLEDLKLTIGIDFYSKTTLYRDKKVKLQIWDYGGEERFRFLLNQYCKGANGAMFLYDITNPTTLSNLPTWIHIIRQSVGDIPIMLVGVKLDLEQYRAIAREEGENLARYYNLSSFVELSARTGQNVESAFTTITELMFDRYRNNSLLDQSHLSELKRETKQTVFRVNRKLALKLENNRTNIYVNGKLFQQCKYLLLNISTDNVRKYDNINSIDEAAEKLDRSLERGSSKYIIDPKTEFWGHCSNIQAWYENEYDTRILHRNLAFPLLKALVDANDTFAKKVFKEEIALRFESGYPSVVFYLIENKYLDFLNEEELSIILENPNFIKQLPRWFFNKIVPQWLRRKIKNKLYKINCPYCNMKISKKAVNNFLLGKKPICPLCFSNFI